MPAHPPIRIRGARQNNLRNLDIDIPTGELVVVTGVSGSGKSSLVFDTLYAEGQRRYVETFSAYARQFLDRMDKPQVDRIEGVPPAIAIDQTNPVRTSRSTVGTMTELNDHLKLLFARAARLHCRCCGKPVQRDTVASIREGLHAKAQQAGDPRLVITFPVQVPGNFSEAEIEQHLLAQGYTRVHARESSAGGAGLTLQVVQDRFRLGTVDDARLGEALEAALHRGAGRMAVHALDDEGNTAEVWRFSSALACADCGIAYADPVPSLFSFNSPMGACETCRGFGRVIGIDLGLVIPDESKTLAQGAVKPWTTESFKECQTDLARHARLAGVAMDIAWKDLPEAHRQWVIEGGTDWAGNYNKQWYGIRRFFDWLESKAYKMHIRVLLSRYRAYTPCGVCHGARLKPDALLWRIGSTEDPAQGRYKRFMPHGVQWSSAQLESMAGLSIHDVMLLPLDRVARLFDAIALPAPLDEATQLLLAEVRARLRYLLDVGLGYLTLDRQSRTLSGGEVQRINLTTALGTSLVNTLFVLDEPSIGLHPRDMGRVIGVMKRLRDAGNSLVVVEHDPQVMFAADRMLDIGPGPGDRGGQIVYWGEPSGLRSAGTLTGDYLSGRRSIDLQPPAPVLANTPRLVLEGAREHNLKNINVEIPLGRLVCLTGVSGSGKSTLMQDVLLPALLKAKGKPSESAGDHDRLLGEDWLEEVVFVDQSPIGKTTRSNPVSYVGAFDAIRKRFAACEVSRERGYTAGTFSFNSGDGRCPTCGGNGFEHVEMQFLSDVYLRCADCDGRRYRNEILEVQVPGQGGTRSVAEVLELTVHEALTFFAQDHDILTRLRPLADVGLDYLRLGQPVPTLSGGEAQRLKLAGFLADAASRGLDKARSKRGSLFLFDEPTTGLHFDDVARLLRALRKLLAAGHSLLVIEHNLDLIRAADWLIDLGPEGGELGGEVVATGTPQDLMNSPRSITGQSLRDYMNDLARAARPHVAEEAGLPLQSSLRNRAREAIVVHKAREHNLKNIDVEIPRNQFTVITGVSGSGKSTLAFDVVFGEGQRRYLESLNAYARQFVQPASRPDVDGVFGIPPTVAIEQRTSRGGRKSTVATLTEIYHFLRLLYVKLGTQHCPSCDTRIEPQSFDAIVARILREHRDQRIGLLAPLVIGRKGVYTDLAKWASGKGFTHLRVDGRFLPTQPWPRIDRYAEHHIELPIADLTVSPWREPELREALRTALDYGKGSLMLVTGMDAYADAWRAGNRTGDGVPLQVALHSTRRACGTCGTSFAELDPRLFSFNSRHGWCKACLGAGLETIGRIREDELTPGLEGATDAGVQYGDAPCPACHGLRLNPTALAVRLREQSIAALTDLPVDQARTWMDGLEWAGREAEIARDVLAEIRSRLQFLSDVGLGYLALSRAAPTLSGGEAQRIRLAAQLGSNLQGVCYVLDEPTIGLHPRDNRVLLDTLDRLRDRGNTLLVVEHDEDTIRRADHVIDIGPGAGRLGGRIVATGPHAELAQQPESLTGRFLAHPLQHPLQPRRAVMQAHPSLLVRGANLHNLQGFDARIPLGRLTVVTGVSGSGKSTFARDVLLANLQAVLAARAGTRNKDAGSSAPPGLGGPIGCAAIEGIEAISRVLEVDQTPIGKTPRSCPATYIGFWDAIRRLFAESTEARVRGYEASRFSFNTGAGRCPACEGQGVQTIEMSFLPDVKVLCDACGGQRFNRETLQVLLRGKSVGEVLAMSVDEALGFFEAHRSIAHPLKLLQDVGLGYLTLGQPSPTLSGGEAQRIKLVTELAKVRDGDAGLPTRGMTPHTLYVLDEPTVGLHMADIDRLIRVLHRLVDAGNTLVVIEHDIDLWAEADWIIDLGPEGGDGGGRLVAAASPEELAGHSSSHTGRILREFMEDRRTGPRA
ncbi:MAG: excinuclease ABC subunit UvrA [Burkholderiaceae bacterium]